MTIQRIAIVGRSPNGDPMVWTVYDTWRYAGLVRTPKLFCVDDFSSASDAADEARLHVHEDDNDVDPDVDPKTVRLKYVDLCFHGIEDTR